MFLVLVAPSANVYLENICVDYIAKTDQTVLERALTDMEQLKNNLIKCEDNILQLAGVGKALYSAQERRQKIDLVIKWLEELLCYAMIDVADLSDMHTNTQLMYQQY